MYDVKINRKTIKNIEKLPIIIQKKFLNLVEDLHLMGPIRPEWPSYSQLSKGKYHCHLSKKWVACWSCKKDSLIIEVYYAGSRENAPY